LAHSASLLARWVFSCAAPIPNNAPDLIDLPRGRRERRERIDLRRLCAATVTGCHSDLRQPGALMELVVWISAGIVLIAIVRVTVKLLSKPSGGE
jgi:hypothetical protein